MFVRAHQKIDAHSKLMLECSYFCYRYEKNEELVKKKQLGKDALLNYMMSDENAPVILDRLDIYQVLHK